MAIDKTKKFADLAYEYIRKLLIKPSKGGITSLPTDKEITNEMLQMFEKLRGAGYNVTNIGKEVKNADDLGFLLNRIDQAQLDQSKQFLDSAEALETIQYKLNNNIPLNPDDQKKLLGKGFKTASEAFQGFTPKIIQGGKGAETEAEMIARMNKQNKDSVARLKQKNEKDLGDKLKDYDGDPDAMAMGGRIEMSKGGGLLDLLKMLKGKVGKKNITTADKIDRPAKAKLADEFKAFNKRNRKLTEDELDELYEEFDEAVPYPMETVADRDRFLKAQKDYEDAMFRDYKAGRLDPKPGEPNRKKFLQKKMEEMEMSGDTKLMTQDEIEELADFEFRERTMNAKGGRIGFEKGGMSRRTFLKLLGGLASIPLVGKFLKPAAKASKAVEVASKSSGVPAYFPKLIEKIKLLGDDITPIAATQERQVVTKYKDYEMTEDLTTGAVQIEKTNMGTGIMGDEIYEGIKSKELIEFKPPETIIGKNNKPVKVPAQYDETTARSTGFDGKLEDFEDGLESIDEILEEVGESKIKKSGGGLAYMMGE